MYIILCRSATYYILYTIVELMTVWSLCSHLHTGLFGAVVPFNLPDVGEAIMTVEVKEWYVLVRDDCSKINVRVTIA